MSELEQRQKTIKDVCRKNNVMDWINGTPTPLVVSIDEIAMDWQERMLKGMSTWTIYNETSRYVATCYYNNYLTTPQFKSIIAVYTNRFGVCEDADSVYELSIKLLRDIGYK